MAERSLEFPSDVVLTDLRRRIEPGEREHGEQITPVADLAGAYDCAGSTVARALAVLAGEGLLIVKARWGTFRT
jgi:DNA-binding GntR family transcriptional regulator